MEVNLYHILFIVLISIIILIGFYPRRNIIKNETHSVLSLKNKNVIEMQGRQLKILDLPRLTNIANQ